MLTAAGANLGKLLGLFRRKAGRFVLALIRWYRNVIAALSGGANGSNLKVTSVNTSW